MIGYARVSTEEQAREGVSMDAQRERLTAYCTAQGYELVALETDNGASGSITPGKRPGLARALARIRRGEADGLLALKLDRISRSTRDVLDLVDESRRRGWRLVSVAEQLDTGSAAGRLVLTVLAALSQMEREQVAERTRMALAELARQGRARSRFAPFGFRTESGASEVVAGTRARLVPHAAEYPLLERMLALRDSGLGATAIARMLTAEGITNRSGGNWTRQSVASVLLGFEKRQAATSCSNGTPGNRAGKSL
jgi:DNA invertase Pin-like site-specific DNA recombinase